MIKKSTDRGAVFVLFSFLTIVLLFAGAGALSLGYIRYERKAIADMADVAAVGAVYNFIASPTQAGQIVYAQQVADFIMQTNREAMKLGRFAKDGQTFDNLTATPGIWDFTNAPNCNSGGTAPGGCYTPNQPVGANALEVKFRAVSGADKIFGGLLNSGRIGRDYVVVAAYDATVGPVVVRP